MKNFKRSLALVLALVMMLGTFASVSALSNGSQAWFADAVYDLQSWGVITEDDVTAAMNGTGINRKTFTLWVAKILSQDIDGKIWGQEAITRYDDVTADDEPYAIAYATANGIVKGYNEGPDYEFGPNDNLILGQAAVVVIRLLSRFGDQGSNYFSSTYIENATKFKDTFGTTEYAAYIWWAQQSGVNVIDSTYKANCGDFSDGAKLTYGEAAYLLWNAAVNGKTATEYDKGANGVEGTIAGRFSDISGTTVNRSYYGIVTDVQNANGYDEVTSITIEIKVAANTVATITLDKTAASKVITTKRNSDNVGNANSDSAYVSVRDFTVGTSVKISYNGNAAADVVKGVITSTTKINSIKSENSVIVDTFLINKYGWCAKNGGYKYNNQYNTLKVTTSANEQKINMTPVLPAYYNSSLAITKAGTETRKNAANTNVTVYKITFKGTTYVLATEGTDGKVYVANNCVAASTDNVLVVRDATGAAADIATVYNSIVNTAEGQMKFTFADTDGNGIYDILTQNKTTVKFEHDGSIINDTNTNKQTTTIFFNMQALRVGEKNYNDTVVNVGTGAAFDASKMTTTNNGLTALLMNNATSTVLPYYTQVALKDAAGAGFTTLTGVVTKVQTIGDIADYYRITIMDASGAEKELIIPAYSKLANNSAFNRTFTYSVGEDSSSFTVNIYNWYEFLIDTYKDQYANNGGNANNFPATEANKPTSLLQKTVTVAYDSNNNVIIINGKDLTTSSDVKEGFVTKVEKASNDNEFKVTLAGTKAQDTATVVASLSMAYDWTTQLMANRLFQKGLLSGTEAENYAGYGVGYVASATNVLYVQVKNDGGNNYLISGTGSAWNNAEISGDITDRIFDAKTTYGTAYTNQTTTKVPTLENPEVVNYYNAYSAENYTWKVVAKEYKKDATTGALTSEVTKVAYEKAPAAIYQVQYKQVSKLAVDYTKSYTLQPVMDGGVAATGATKVLAPFTVYKTEAGKENETIINPTYAEIYAYQTHKYYDDNGNLNTEKGYGYFFNDDNGYIGNLSNETITRYYVDANNIVYTILDYKGIVYQTKADGTLVVTTETMEEVAGSRTDVTTAAMNNELAGITKSYITTTLPSNTVFSAHKKGEGYKYVPGWYRLEIKGAETINVKEDTTVIIVTPDETIKSSKTELDYTYTETTVGALLGAKKELAVLSYQYVVDEATGYVKYIKVFGGTNTIGSNSEAINPGDTTTPSYKVDDGKAIVYLPADSLTTSYIATGSDIYYVSSSMQAINITTGEKVGTLNYFYSTWNYAADYVNPSNGHTVTIPAGHFYLVDTTKNNAILQDLGGVFGEVTVNRLGVGVADQYGYGRGCLQMPSTTAWVNQEAHWIVAANKLTYKSSIMNETNYDIDSTKLTTGTVLGQFGTMKITNVTPKSIIATVNGNANQDITNLNFKFVYFDYEGNTLNEATAQTVSHALPTTMYEVMFQSEKAGMPNDFNSNKGTFATWCENNLSNTKAFYYYDWTKASGIASIKTNIVNTGKLDLFYNMLAEYTPAGMLNVAVEKYNNLITSNATISEINEAFALVELCQKYYAEACEAFNNNMNDIYWTSDVQNSKLYQYKIAQITSGVAESAIVYPEFTYYYDYATQTYTVFINSFITK